MSFFLVILCFFIYIFPNIFLFNGEWEFTKVEPTIFYFLSISLWVLFILINFVIFIYKPSHNYTITSRIIKNNYITIGTIKAIEQNDQSHADSIKYLVEFKNLAGNNVYSNFLCKKKYTYRIGDIIKLYLNTSDEKNPSPSFLTEHQVKNSNIKILLNYLIFIFQITFSILSYLFYLHYYKNLAYLSFYNILNPWSVIPFLGSITLLLIMSGSSVTSKAGSKSEYYSSLLLRGYVGQAKVNSWRFTGEVIFDPIVEYEIEFLDTNGMRHSGKITENIDRVNLYKLQLLNRPILFFKNDPTVFRFMPINSNLTPMKGKPIVSKNIDLYNLILNS